MRPSAGELLESSMFHNMNAEFEDVKGGEVNMMDTIRCPKVLKHLNGKLPNKSKCDEGSKKIVSFASKDCIEGLGTPAKENRLLRKIRSEKVIKMPDEEPMKAPRGHYQFKLPPVEKEQTS